MKSSGKFESALLDRLVQALRPDFAAVVCGPGESLVFSAVAEQKSKKPDPRIVEKVLESKQPVSDWADGVGRLAVPYLDDSDNVEGVMYVEVNAPRRLKKIDLAILERLREQIESRRKASTASTRSQSARENEAGARKTAEATLDIVTRVLKPPRAVVFALIEGELKALATRGPQGESFSAEESLDFGLIESLLQNGESTHLEDVFAPQALARLNLARVTGDSRSVACAPMRNSSRQVRGLVFLDSTTETGVFDGSELVILERLARSLEGELAWVLDSQGGDEKTSEELEPVPEPSEDDFRSRYAGETIDAGEHYNESQILGLETDDRSVEPEMEQLEGWFQPEVLEIERAPETIESETESQRREPEFGWPEFEFEAQDQAGWPEFESESRDQAGWPEFQTAPPDQSGTPEFRTESSYQSEEPEFEPELEPDRLEIAALEKENQTTEDTVPPVSAEKGEQDREQPDPATPSVPPLEELFALSDEPLFSLEPPVDESDRGSLVEPPSGAPIDSAEVLFQAPEIPDGPSDISRKLEQARATQPAEPAEMLELLESAKARTPKKNLRDDDILRSLLEEKPSEGRAEVAGAGSSLEVVDTGSLRQVEGAGSTPEIEEASQLFPQEELSDFEPAEKPAPPFEKPKGSRSKPSLIKRAWRFFWPFGTKDGAYLTPVTVCGEVFLDGRISNDAPVEVILLFPDHRMRVTLQLTEEESEYFFSGNFSGEEPPRMSLRVQKKGYFPVKIAKIKLDESEDGFRAELNPIELLSREL